MAEIVEAIILGARQAGLSVAYYLNTSSAPNWLGLPATKKPGSASSARRIACSPRSARRSARSRWRGSSADELSNLSGCAARRRRLLWPLWGRSPIRADVCAVWEVQLPWDALLPRLSEADAWLEMSGAKSYEPFLHVERAELARLTGDEGVLEQELREAHRLFTEIGAPIRAAEVAKELDK